MTIGLTHYLIVSAVLLALGLFTIATRKNAVSILMGVELVLNAGIVNLVAFSAFMPKTTDGQVFAIFGIVLAASEAVVALAIMLQLYRAFRTVDATASAGMKE
ncbi:MAG: NADH-quinone oxidoreductase subunit NuoK [Deltaproteobacteria bacterium]|nr:NADH-quinone oxidoreductase subunit NuoK [Deltaproteobacteria bacterium]